MLSANVADSIRKRTQDFEANVRGVEVIDNQVKTQLKLIKDKLSIQPDNCIHCKHFSQKQEVRERQLAQKNRQIQTLKAELKRAQHMGGRVSDAVERRDIPNHGKFEYLNQLSSTIERDEQQLRKIENKALQLKQKQKSRKVFIKKMKDSRMSGSRNSEISQQRSLASSGIQQMSLEQQLLKNQQERIQVLMSQNEELKNSNQKLNVSIFTIQNQTAKIETIKTKLEKQNFSLVLSLDQKTAHFQQESNTMHFHLNRLQQENDVMRKQLISLQGASEKIGLYQKEIYTLSKELENLSHQNSQKQKAILESRKLSDDFSSQLHQEKQENNRRVLQLQYIQDSNNKLVGQNHQLKSDIQKLITDSNMFESVKQQLLQQNGQKANEWRLKQNELIRDNHNLQACLLEQKQMRALQSQNGQERQKRIFQLQERDRNLEENIKIMSDQMQNIRNQMLLQQDMKESALNQIAQLESKLQDDVDKIIQQQRQIQLLKNQSQQKEISIEKQNELLGLNSALKLQISQLEDQIRKDKKQIESAQLAKLEVDDALKNLRILNQNELELLKLRLSEQNIQTDKIRQQLEAQKEQNAQLNEVNKQLDKEISEKEVELEERDLEIKNMIEKNQKALLNLKKFQDSSKDLLKSQFQELSKQKERELTQKQLQILQLKRQHDNITKDLRIDISKLEAELLSKSKLHQQSLAFNNNKVQSLSQQCDQHSQNLKTIQMQLSNKEQQLKNSENKLQQMGKQLQQLKKDHENAVTLLRTELSEREVEIEIKDQQIQKINLSKDGQIEKLKENNEKTLQLLRVQLSEREVELEFRDQELENLARQKQEAINNLTKQQQAAMEVLRSELSEREVELDIQGQEIQTKNKQKDQFIKKLKNEHELAFSLLRAELSEREVELESRQNRIEKVVQQKNEMICKLKKEHQTTFSMLRNELSEREVELQMREKKLKEEVLQKSKENNLMSRQYEQAFTMLRNQLSERQNQLAMRDQQLKQKDEERKQSQKENQKTIELLRSQLSQREVQIEKMEKQLEQAFSNKEDEIKKIEKEHSQKLHQLQIQKKALLKSLEQKERYLDDSMQEKEKEISKLKEEHSIELDEIQRQLLQKDVELDVIQKENQNKSEENSEISALKNEHRLIIEQLNTKIGQLQIENQNKNHEIELKIQEKNDNISKVKNSLSALELVKKYLADHEEQRERRNEKNKEIILQKLSKIQEIKKQIQKQKEYFKNKSEKLAQQVQIQEELLQSQKQKHSEEIEKFRHELEQKNEEIETIKKEYFTDRQLLKMEKYETEVLLQSKALQLEELSQKYVSQATELKNLKAEYADKIKYLSQEISKLEQPSSNRPSFNSPKNSNSTRSDILSLYLSSTRPEPESLEIESMAHSTLTETEEEPSKNQLKLLSNLLLNKQMQLSETSEENVRLSESFAEEIKDFEETKQNLFKVVSTLNSTSEKVDLFERDLKIKVEIFEKKLNRINKIVLNAFKKKDQGKSTQMFFMKMRIRQLELEISENILEHQKVEKQFDEKIQCQNLKITALEQKIMDGNLQNLEKQSLILDLELNQKKKNQQISQKNQKCSMEHLKTKVLSQLLQTKTEKAKVQGTFEEDIEKDHIEPLIYEESPVNAFNSSEEEIEEKEENQQRKEIVSKFESLKKLQNQQLNFVQRIEQQLAESQKQPSIDKNKSQFLKLFDELLSDSMGEKYNKKFASQIQNILTNDIHILDIGYYHLLRRCFEEQKFISQSISQHIKRNNEIFSQIKIDEDEPVSQATRSPKNNSS